MSFAGYVFIVGVSIAGAFRVEEITYRILFIVSARLSLILAITRIRNKNMAKKIQMLEEYQLSVKHDVGEGVFALIKELNHKKTPFI